MATYTKTERGGWAFTLDKDGFQMTFEALRNIGGFAHRDWEVWTSKADGSQGQCVDDQIPTRQACFEEASAFFLDQHRGRHLSVVR